MKINTNQQEVEYRGLFFPFNAVKKSVLAAVETKQIPSELLRSHCIHKTFNKHTGKIDRKYAWDSVFADLYAKGWLEELLNGIIQKEYLD
jgi:hypothetical protein